MEDLERYGDYDDREYEETKKSGIVGTVIKTIVAVVCISIIAILGFRLFIFKTYPASMKNIYFTDRLSEYYNANEGDINAETQTLRAPYDNPDFANFFCDNLIVVKEAGELQVSVRYNQSAIEEIQKKHNLSDLVGGSEDLFSYKLVDNNGRVCENLTYTNYESKYMYHYIKLAFSDVEFEDANWIRLEITVNGSKNDTPYRICIYENNENYSRFDSYKISKGEKPAE